ncbi:MAG: hypothetical protein EAY81_05880 [Bacteroidetes bacterium]|nr:MAG: hypothetical protein EAY81_05880 [Bacteroidota bacterium]
MTDFIEFITKTGTRKQTVVKTVKKRPKYSPGLDYWKQLRDALIMYHTIGQNKEVLNELLNNIAIKSKMTNYGKIIGKYLEFIGNKRYSWFIPPYGEYNIDELNIRVNPELGWIRKNKKYIIKLYFKDEPLTRHEVDILLLLMKEAFKEEKDVTNYDYAILEVQRGKLHERKINNSIQPLLEGEARSFATIWSKLED